MLIGNKEHHVSLIPFFNLRDLWRRWYPKGSCRKKNEQKEAPGNSDKGFPGAEGLPKMADYNPSFFFT